MTLHWRCYNPFSQKKSVLISKHSIDRLAKTGNKKSLPMQAGIFYQYGYLNWLSKLIICA